MLFSAALFNPALTYHGDDHSYILLARSISSGRGYIELFHPENKPHTQYPPVYPTALAALGSICGERIIVFKMFSVVCGFFALAAAWLLLRGKLASGPLSLMLCAAAMNGVMLDFSSSVLSEMPFVLILFSALLILGARPEQISWKRFACGAFLCAATFYARSAGVFFIAGIGLYLLYKKALVRAIVFGLISVAVICPWAIRNSGLEESAGGGYVGGQLMAQNYYDLDAGKASPKDLAVRSIKNTIHIFLVELPSTFAPQISGFALSEITEQTKKMGMQLRDLPRAVAKNPSPKMILSIFLIFCVSPALVFIFLKGFAGEIKSSGADCFHFIVVVYVGLMTLWPEVWLHFRLFLPVYFFFWLYFTKGLGSFKFAEAESLSTALIVFIIVSLAAITPGAFKNSAANISDIKAGALRSGPPPEMQSFVASLEWLKTNAPESARVASRYPGIAYYYSGKRGYWFPYTRKKETLARFIIEGKYNYAIADNSSSESKSFLEPFIKSEPGAFSKVFQDGPDGAAIYKINSKVLMDKYHTHITGAGK